MDLRSTGMEFASEFVIKATHWGARIAEIPITLCRTNAAAAAFAEFSRRMAHFAIMLFVRSKLAVCVARRSVYVRRVALVFWLLPGQERSRRELRWTCIR